MRGMPPQDVPRTIGKSIGSDLAKGRADGYMAEETVPLKVKWQDRKSHEHSYLALG